MAKGNEPTQDEIKALLREFYHHVLDDREEGRACLVSPFELDRLKRAAKRDGYDADDDDEIPADALAEMHAGLEPEDLIPDLFIPVATSDDWRRCLEDNAVEAVAPDVSRLLKKRGLPADGDDEWFKHLCRKALVLGLRAMEDDQARQAEPEKAGWVDALLAGNDGAPSRTVATATMPVETPVVQKPDRVGPAVVPEPGSENGAAPDPAPLLSEAVEQRIKTHGRHWDLKSLRDARKAFALMGEFFGDVPLTDIKRVRAEDFRAALDRMPRLHGKGVFKGLGLRDAINLADELEDASKAGAKDARLDRLTFAQSGKIERLSPKTVNKHLTYANGMVDHAIERHELPIKNPFSKLLYAKKILGKARDQREAWSDEEIANLLTTPVWTGCHSEARRAMPGTNIIRDARFWLPLIGAHAGLRLEEAAQLHADDIEQVDGVWCFRVRPGVGKVLKSPAATRDIPIHSTLARIGLIDHAARVRANGERQLWPDLERGGPYQLLGYRFSKWFTEYRRAVGLYEPRKDFHSFRHSFATHTRDSGIPLDVRQALMGHVQHGETAERYGKAVKVKEYHAAIERIDYGAALDHLFIR